LLAGLDVSDIVCIGELGVGPRGVGDRGGQQV
jgi:hypothetical protein